MSTIREIQLQDLKRSRNKENENEFVNNNIKPFGYIFYEDF